MKILIILWIITMFLTIYYFVPKIVMAGNEDGIYIKITRPYGWKNDIEIKSFEITYIKKEAK